MKMYLKIFVTRNENQRENICKYLSIEPLLSGARGVAVCRLVTAAFYICSPQYMYAYIQIQPNTTKYNPIQPNTTENQLSTSCVPSIYSCILYLLLPTQNNTEFWFLANEESTDSLSCATPRLSSSKVIKTFSKGVSSNR